MIVEFEARTLVAWGRLLLAASSMVMLLACANDDGVWLTDDAIYYRGDLSEARNQRVYDLYEEAVQKPNLLVISSGGGEVHLGLDLGNFIWDEQLDVSVPGYCLSSCANYIFTAGRRKLLGKHAVLGFHGGATSPGYLEDVRR